MLGRWTSRTLSPMLMHTDSVFNLSLSIFVFDGDTVVPRVLKDHHHLDGQADTFGGLHLQRKVFTELSLSFVILVLNTSGSGFPNSIWVRFNAFKGKWWVEKEEVEKGRSAVSHRKVVLGLTQ